MNLKERLNHMIQTEAIPHALLFAGGEAEAVAYQFAKDVICLSGAHFAKKVESRSHPDLHIYLPEGKTVMHSMASLRELSLEVSRTSFESKWKVFIIHDAERMPPPAANALLKTLEEPTSHTLILLISRHPERIMPTVKSRCQTFEFVSSKPQATEILELLAEKITKEEFEKKYQEQMTQDIAFQNSFFEMVMLWFRDRELLEMGEGLNKYLAFPEWSSFIRQSPNIPLESIEKILKSTKLALERSVKLSHCLEYLFLSINNR